DTDQRHVGQVAVGSQGGRGALDVSHFRERVLELPRFPSALSERSVVEGEGDETPLGQRSSIGTRGLVLHARQWSRDHGGGACLGGRGHVEVAHNPYAVHLEAVASPLAHRARHDRSYTEPVPPDIAGRHGGRDRDKDLTQYYSQRLTERR